MSQGWDRLHAAMAAVNREEIGAVEREHRLRFLDLTGPIFTIYGIHVRGLFVGEDGRHWVDAALWHESSWGEFTGFTEWALEAVGSRGLGFDFDVVTLERGQHSASMVAVDDLTDLCELAPAVVTASLWARSWRSWPWMSDRQGHALVEAGVPGEPGLFDTAPARPVRARGHLAAVPDGGGGRGEGL